VIKTIKTFSNDFLHLFFPHHCEGCGSDVIQENHLLCLHCHAKLPETGFFNLPGNPVEKNFYGRLKIEAAGAAYYFTKDSLMQHLITQLKYHGKKEIGESLGSMTGQALMQAERFTNIDCIVPLPLNEKKQQKRGYNQAAAIAEGIAAITSKPMIQHAVTRKLFTETQTKKDRVHRWQSMQEVFDVKHPSILENKHVLLVDDIVTTGATLEACGSEMLKVPGVKLSIATVCWTI